MGTIKVSNIEKANGDAVDLTKQEGVKAWVAEALQVGGVSYVGSFNVTSIVDTAAGRISVNLTNTMSDVNYAVVNAATNNYPYHAEALTTSQFTTETVNSSASFSDGGSSAAILGDLA